MTTSLSDEIVKLQSYLNTLKAQLTAVNVELAPGDRKWTATWNAIRATHDERGFFRGERQTVDSARWVKGEIYETVSKTVIVRDPVEIDRRKALFAELDSIANTYGAQRERRRKFVAEIKITEKDIERLQKAEAKTRQKKLL